MSLGPGVSGLTLALFEAGAQSVCSFPNFSASLLLAL